MNKKMIKLLALLIMTAGLIVLMMLMAGTQSASAALLYEGTPEPTASTPTPQPTGGKGSLVTQVETVVNQVVFPADTISKAIGQIFVDMAKGQTQSLVKDYATWYQAIGEIIQAPSAGFFANIANKSWPVAAALAPALFILRIALYNWNRLLGEEDSAQKAAGDIITALVLAVLCGWFLDLIVRLGWWMTGAAVGETGVMAVDFIKTMSVEGVIESIPNNVTFAMMWGIIVIAVELGALLAVAGMLMAFASAQAGLFLLAVIGPSLAVASVIPQMRWMRSLWIKAVSVIAILPLVAGAIFKACTFMGAMFIPGGILALFIRIMWLWGATGAMLSLAGILGKLTITTTTDAIGQLMNAVKGIVDVAAVAALGVATGGAGAAAGAGALGAGGAGLTGGAAFAGGGGAEGAGLTAGGAESLASASSHLGAAQNMSAISGLSQAMGLDRTAGFTRTLSNIHSLAARKAELTSRMNNFGRVNRDSGPAETGIAPGAEVSSGAGVDIGFPASNDVVHDFLKGYGGPADKARSDLTEMAHLFPDSIKPDTFVSRYPEKAGLMASIYSNERSDIDSSKDPLWELSHRVGLPYDDAFGG